ncbi:MAG: hypothetical protein AAGI44_09015, partial [Pseudomonadota bacterium]
QVVEGNTYYIAAYAFDESRGNYQLSVSFEPSIPGSAPSDVSGLYSPDFSEPAAFCLFTGPIFLESAQNEFRVEKNGSFSLVVSGVVENDSNLIYRVYASDLENGTVVRRDTSVFRDARGEPEILVDLQITADFVGSRIVGESQERLVVFDPSDGSVLDNCFISATFIGEKIADLDGSGDRDVSR